MIMKYQKFDGGSAGIASKIALLFSVFTVFMCAGLIYKVYDLQVQILELEKKCRLEKDPINETPSYDNEEDPFKVLNQSAYGFQWNTGTSDYPEEDYDNDSDYYYLDSGEFLADKLGAAFLTKDNLEKRKREKREVLTRTVDGVPINSESYTDAKKKNKTSVTTSSPATYVRRSRVMRTEDKSKAFKRVIKRPLVKSSDLVLQEEEMLQIPHRRRHRQRRVDSGERTFRFRPAIHLNGDVYNSNGWSHHEADHYKNWSRETWVKTLEMDKYFFLDNGYLRIIEPGLYLVYAQVLYFDEHDTNGFYVYRNDDIILQCTTTSHSNHRVRKSNTCYTAGVSHLVAGDRLRVHDIESYRYSIFRPGKSFFGAIKLSDVRRSH